ncbi:MAG: AraC family transcriptional regulator [Clostridia bacterium]|nr:AraC family transcriptional regulator [Clostridia bacterium]
MKPYLKKQVTNNNLWRPYVYYWNTFPGRWPFVEPHFHPEFAIHYMVQGSMLFSLNDEHILASEGDIIFIQPNTVYSITPPTDLIGMKNYHTFIFDSDFLCGSVGASCYTEILSPIIQNQANFSCVITKDHPYYEEIQTSLENIVSAAKIHTPLLTLLIKSELLRLFYFVLEYGDHHKSTTSNQSLKNLQPVLSYINKNFEQNITLEQLANLSNLSVSRFTTKFKQIMGVSAITYVNQVRLKRACQLLITTNDPILNIATVCGFNNISNFNVLFKRAVGCSPHDYRKRYSSADNK